MEIAINIIIGLITGISAGFIYAIVTKELKNRQLAKKFKPITGNYINRMRKENGDTPILARAKLCYLFERRFTIEVFTYLHYLENIGQPFKPENIEHWTGEIIMDTIRSGTIIWEQVNPANGKNGFKRIIINKELNEITLVGEGEHGFGVEKFPEKEKKRNK